MSDYGETIRSIKQYIDQKIFDLEVVKEGIVTDHSKNGKLIRVRPLPFNKFDTEGHWMPYLMPIAGNGSQMGALPAVGSKVLILFITQNQVYKYENCIAFGGIFDNETNISPDRTDIEDAAKTDPLYFVLQPQAEESKIEIYKDMIRTTAKKDYYERVLSGKKVILSNKIYLGEDDLTSDDNKIVLKPLIDKYNNMLTALNNILLQLFTMPFIGDMGLPMPLAVRSSGAFSAYTTWAGQVDTQFKDTFLPNTTLTDKTRAK